MMTVFLPKMVVLAEFGEKEITYKMCKKMSRAGGGRK